MPFSDLRPRLLTALLLAIFAFSALPCLAAGQEATAKATDAPPAANADNATKWDIPPEVEALFPNDMEFSEKYERINVDKARDFTTSPWTKRIHREFFSGTYKGICYDLYLNVELWGGEYAYGCNDEPINRRHPRRELFQSIGKWEKLNPRENVNIIREYYILNWQTKANYDQKDPEHEWRIHAPTIKWLLQKENLLAIERTKVDINEDGVTEFIYRFATPRQLCKKIDDSFGYRWNYFILEDIPIRLGFNKTIRGCAPIYYDGKLYFINNMGAIKVLTGDALRREKNFGYYYSPICTFKVRQ